MRRILAKRSNRIYLYGIFAYMVLSLFIYWDHELDIMNTTVFAFSYQYGFMPRGVLGTILWLYDMVTPFDAISYNTIYFISKVGTGLFFVVLIWFVVAVMSRCRDEHLTSAKWIMAVLVIISVPMFLGRDNFGRLDVYLMILTFFCLILIIYEKAEWLIIPAVTLSALIHEGFVFMNINIILVLLLYKCITKTDIKLRRKYIIILALTFIMPSIIFLYCEFFSHNLGPEVFDQCLAVATKVSANNDPHEEVLLHEILGLSVNDMELKHRIWNFEDASIFLVLFAPYLVFLFFVLKRYAKTGKTAIDHFISFMVIAAPLTLVPEIVLKVDYGRYVYAVLFYYLAIFACLLAMRDARIEETVAYYKTKILKYKWLGIIGVLYLFAFTPFRGYRICDLVTWLAEMIYGKLG